MIEKSFDITLDVQLLPYKIVKAGNLICIYEAGNLRYIKCGDTEIVRMIYGAVRNENWEIREREGEARAVQTYS